ncbi:MAG TPA: DUF4395 domain-containing protein [Acidimicrobiia bacterium]|nr:DUF4395 domain-containing protein [Acidimicrobiia bacterium]
MKPQIDVNLPRINQAAVALLTAIAFVLQWWPLVAIAWATIAVTRAFGHRYGLWSQLYLRFARPRLATAPETEWSAPPRFAQTLGVLFLGAATVLLATGLTVAGWAVTLIVTALATLSAAARICVGCLLYEGVVTR